MAWHGRSSSGMQGTTTNGNFLLPFKTGAFLAGVPVQPVILQYGKVMPLKLTIPIVLAVSLGKIGLRWRESTDVDNTGALCQTAAPKSFKAGAAACDGFQFGSLFIPGEGITSMGKHFSTAPHFPDVCNSIPQCNSI